MTSKGWKRKATERRLANLLKKIMELGEEEDFPVKEFEHSLFEKLYETMLEQLSHLGISTPEGKKPETRRELVEKIREMAIHAVGEINNEHISQSDRKDQFFLESGYEDQRGDLKGSYVIRKSSSNKEIEDVAPYYKDIQPNPERTYVSLSDLLASLGFRQVKEEGAKFQEVVTYLLLTSPNEAVVLGDGYETTVDKAFFWGGAWRNYGGKAAYYCDSKSGLFLLEEAGIYPKRPEDTTKVTASEMNKILGRDNSPKNNDETENYLLVLLETGKVQVGKKEIDTSPLIAIYRSRGVHRRQSGGYGYAVYCEPELEEALREYLPCNLPKDKEHWVIADRILEGVKMKRDPLNRASVVQILKRLHAANEEVFTAEGQPMKARECVRRFAMRGSGEVWKVDPRIIGKAITKDMIIKEKEAILENRELYEKLVTSKSKSLRS